jgi:hypothetical protein
VKSAGVPVTYAHPAIDHVVTYDFWRGFGPKGGDRVTVWRHRSLLRQTTEFIGSKRPFDPPSETNYANLATGASASGTLRPRGQNSGFTFWRETEKTRGRYRYNLVKTAEQRTIAGERCTMWRADPIGKRGDVFTGVARRGCIASDGVVLYDAWLYTSGGVAEERTATKVRRRKVTLAEVLPPRDAMSWSAWLQRAASLRPRPTGRPDNYDVELRRKTSMDGPDDPDRIRNRASGGWQMGESWSGPRRIGFNLSHSSHGLRLTESSESLGIYFQPEPKVTPTGFGEKATNGQPGKVLGEQCHWFDAAVNVSDYSRYECRSKDGLPLIVKENSWGNAKPPLIAVSLRRGKTRLRDLMPSRSTMSWAAWGWPELAGRQAGTP